MSVLTPQDRRQASVGEPFVLGARLAARNVLVVEDDESSQDYYQQLFDVLYPDEFRCLVAASGERAWAALQGRAFDAVILDWNLPGTLDGLAVLRRLREEPGLEGLPVLMVSARDDAADADEALDAGADDYLAKPASPDELIARLRALLGPRS